MQLIGTIRPKYLINSFITPIFKNNNDELFIQEIDYETNLILSFIKITNPLEDIQMIDTSYDIYLIEVKEKNDAIYAYRSDSKNETFIYTKYKLEKKLSNYFHYDFAGNPFPKMVIASFIGCHNLTMRLSNETNSFFKKSIFEYEVDVDDYLPNKLDKLTFESISTELLRIKHSSLVTEGILKMNNFIAFSNSNVYISNNYYFIKNIDSSFIEKAQKKTDLFDAFFNELKRYIETDRNLKDNDWRTYSSFVTSYFSYLNTEKIYTLSDALAIGKKKLEPAH